LPGDGLEILRAAGQVRLRKKTSRPRGRVHKVARVGRGKCRQRAGDFVAIGADRDPLSGEAMTALHDDRPGVRGRECRDFIGSRTDGERRHAQAQCRCRCRQQRLVGARQVMRRIAQ